MTQTIHLDRSTSVLGWDRDCVPAVAVQSGAEIAFEIQDASGGQVTADSDHQTIARLDFARVNPVTGPVFVEGARPGDVLQVEILQIDTSSFGWTAQIPGFGLLSDDFPDPWLHVWEIRDGGAYFRNGIEVAVRPMCGVLGVSPAEPGTHSVVPPRRVGGNLDIPQLGAGATLYLPIEVEGALFGAGDTHAAQGDGEVCGTAIESPMTAHLRLTVRRDMDIEFPEFEVPAKGDGGMGKAYACTGVEPDLMLAAKQAVRGMIRHLSRSYGLDEQEAYALCSVAVDLRISELVDAPNWVVSAFLSSEAVGERT